VTVRHCHGIYRISAVFRGKPFSLVTDRRRLVDHMITDLLQYRFLADNSESEVAAGADSELLRATAIPAGTAEKAY